MLTLVLLGAALAADTDRLPLQAPVTLPDCAGCESGEGVFRIPVPLALRSSLEGDDGPRLQLLGPDGAVIPIAVARGGEGPERAVLSDWLLVGGDTIAIEEQDRPIDGVVIDVPPLTLAEVDVQAWVEDAWRPWGETTRIWRHPSEGARDQISFPATRGPLRVRVKPLSGVGPWSSLRVDGLRHGEGSVPEMSVRLPVASAVLEEDGWSRYVVRLPGALPIHAVTLHPDGDIFSRDVVLRRDLRDDIGWSPSPVAGSVKRIDVGGATADLTRVPVPEGFGGDTLVIYIEDGPNAPLDLPEVTVHLDGSEVFVRDPGPGPWTLQGGGGAGDGAAFDLAVALPELRRMVSATAAVGEAVANPDYQTPEDRSGLSAPGPVLDLGRYTWRLSVEGDPGLARITLPPSVVDAAAPVLRDIRLVTDGDRQVPRILQRSATDPDLGTLTWTREERDGESQLRVRMPQPATPVATVTLGTDAVLFDRRVTIQRIENGVLVPLRSFRWQGTERPGVMSLRIDEPVGEELIISIANDDDPPLSITGVSATRPGWEMLAVLPETPTWIYGGADDRDPPSYDLQQLGEELDRRAAVSVMAGEPEPLEKPPPSPVERGVLLAGLGVLVAGLGLLTLRLLRSVPEDAVDETATPGASSR